MSSVIRPDTLFKTIKEQGVKAIAITDHTTLSGVWGCYKAAKTAGIKLIVGCSFNFVYDLSQYEIYSKNNKKKNKPTEQIKNLVLIAQNQIGYQNLLRINRESFNTKFGKLPLTSWELLEKYKEGLFCLTGDANGILALELCNNNKPKAIENFSRLHSIYGDNLYVEFIPNNLKTENYDQFLANRSLFNLYKELRFNVVAASNAKYINREQAKYLDLIYSIKTKRGFNPDEVTNNQQYLHTAEDIVAFFKRNFGEEFSTLLCSNSVKIAKKCEKPEWIKPEILTNDKIQLPPYPVKDDEDYPEFLIWKSKISDELQKLDEDKLFMRFICDKNLYKVPQDKLEDYKKRLDVELPVFEQLGFSSYMLITYDFINWARKQGIPVGPGRGSVGGSMVGYLLGIHQADPIKYGLIFERFLNLEKTSFPDIDNDFDSEGRERVLQYITEKYGADFVAHVSNILTFTPKVAITDVITCLKIGGDRKEAFKIAKNITETVDAKCKTLESAMESSKLLAEFLKEHPEVKEYAEAIVGLIRGKATHAAGVVINKYPLPGLVPLRLDDNNVVTLEWEKEQTEENGLVKVDFLGLETLTIIKSAIDMRKALNKPELPPINFDDPYPDIYEMIKNGNTFGIFQLGASNGTVGLCNMTEPKTINDVAVINALARPGVPTEIKKSYINRKFGREKVIIPHPNLERAVKETFGYCIFEESFLFLAHDFCGWNLQKSDKMRKISKLKAKGKKILEEMQGEFVATASEYSVVPPELPKKIWDEWVIPLSGYSFNKSHSILYSMTSLMTAYLKSRSHNEFMTANLISETLKNSPKTKNNIIKYKAALKNNGVKICAPHINESFSNYRLIEEDKLLTGFSALKGVKEPAAQDIISKRPYTSFEDLLLKTNVRITTIQALAASGALDCFGLSRKSMCLYGYELKKKLRNLQKRGFITSDCNIESKVKYTLPKEEYSLGELRNMEFRILGQSISGSKKDSFPKLFSGNKAVSSVAEILQMSEKTNTVIEGEIVDMFTFKVKKEGSKIFGQECCMVMIEDLDNKQIKTIFFPEAYENLKTLFKDTFPTKKFEKGFGIRVGGYVNKYDNQISLVANDLYALFMPVEAPNKIENKKIEVTTIGGNKKTKEISQDDIEKDLLLSL